MLYVYLLRSSDTGKIYTGFTKDLKKRFASHRAGEVFATKSMGKLELVHYEAFKDKRDAIRREKYLKSSKGKRAVRLMLKYSLDG